MDRRVVFDECASSHENYRCKLSQRHKSEEHFLQAELNMGFIQVFVYPDNHCIVN